MGSARGTSEGSAIVILLKGRINDNIWQYFNENFLREWMKGCLLGITTLNYNLDSMLISIDLRISVVMIRHEAVGLIVTCESVKMWTCERVNMWKSEHVKEWKCENVKGWNLPEDLRCHNQAGGSGVDGDVPGHQSHVRELLVKLSVPEILCSRISSMALFVYLYLYSYLYLYLYLYLCKTLYFWLLSALMGVV